ncbi:unnamed protein product [Orchesella dallaii]|uniref:Major facilitator superfamily (MFS) profile domain-containing protein n=1 Tax=Orchesella dallaii TaxID=48710 RepID=A0ABP1RLP6_9HEXA
MGNFLQYNHLASISEVISVVLGIILFFVPESPRWLISVRRRKEAVNSLCWLQACHKKSPTQNILLETQESILIASTLMFFRDACGGNMFSFFAIQTFDKTGSAFNSHVSGVIIGIAQLLGILVTMYYVDKLGRRRLLIASFIIMSLALTIVGLFQHFKPEMNNWTYTVTSEIILTNVIGSISGLGYAIGRATAFMFTRSYQDIIDGIGLANTFWVFAVLSAAGGICTFFLVPETAVRQLENIHQEGFCNDTGTKENYELRNP